MLETFERKVLKKIYGLLKKSRRVDDDIDVKETNKVTILGRRNKALIDTCLLYTSVLAF